MAVHEGVLVLLLLLGCSCEAQLKSGFLVKTPQVAAVYQNGLGAPQVVAAGYQVGAGAPQVSSTGFQVGVGAPQVASTGYQVGVGAPQVASTGFQVGVGAPQVASTGFQVGVGAPQVASTGYQAGVGATKLGATGYQVGVGATKLGATGYQVGVGATKLGATGYQVGVGAPQVASTGFLVGAGATKVGATGYQVGVGAPQVGPAGFQVGVGAPQVASTGFQVGVGAPQVASTGFLVGAGATKVGATGYQVGVGAPQVASTGYQVGVGAPQVASTGFQVGAGAPQVASTGFQVGAGAPQVASTGFQVGAGAPQVASTGFQVGVGATKLGATGYQVGVGAPQVASTGFQVGVGATKVGATGFQVGVGAPQVASTGFLVGAGATKVGVTGYLSKQAAPALVKSVTGMQVNPDSVRVVCGEDSVMVDVLQDLLAIGQLINASDITLGGCAPTGQDASGTVRLQSVLQACGSTLMMTADALVYSFALIYTPRGINGLPIVRTNGAVVGIECHYLRKQNVSSNALVPTWIPYYATMAAEAQLSFSLRLMDDAWQNERASNVYFLGSVLNIEASVLVGNSQPLRVFVDSCVATLVPDVTSVPSYAFVQNSGCLTDAKVTGSRSQFLPRKQDDKLQLQLDAFRFSQDGRSSLYITCSLRATVASVPVDSQHKACSFPLAANRWMSVDGNDQVCGCCDTSCGLAGVAGAQGTGVLGPIAIQQGPPTASQPGQLYILKG
ncbi:uncharacterized protein LOC125710092 isoform X47 [Brienomyrus brachyistius]|uniref:uncharacterized protein LOC125710092 isoform X47 n=1 Tax=Brienomyrus brachyistius TaxID=42636 RepID=UPI0020B30AD0|nr:uncharacterized protein LOC125710092 isoform X47 [Brienomyrus brachyistius]